MNKIYVAVIAVLIGGTALIFNFVSGDDSRPSRPGVVLQSAPPAAVAERRTVASTPAAPSVGGAALSRRGTRLVLGRITTNVDKHLPRLEAMANYLTTELADQGVTGVDIRITDTLEEMRDLFRAGEVDLVSETAFGAIELERDGLAQMLLREWKSGVASYSTVIFTRRDSGIGGLEDLVGRSLAFEDRGSTSGYLVPRAYLARAGYDLQELESVRAQVPASSIGFTFSDEMGDGGAVGQVLRGAAEVGAMSNLDWDDDEVVSEEDRRDLVIIQETDPIIRSVMLVRTSLNPIIKDRVAATLENMHESVAGRTTLRAYSKVALFDRIEGDAIGNLMNARFMYEIFSSF